MVLHCYTSVLRLSKNNHRAEKIVITITITNQSNLISPVIIVSIRAIKNIDIEAIVAQTGASAIPVLNFCLAIPPRKTVKNTNNKSIGER